MLLGIARVGICPEPLPWPQGCGGYAKGDLTKRYTAIAKHVHEKVAGNPELRTLYGLTIGCLVIAKLDQAASSQEGIPARPRRCLVAQ